MSKRACVCKGEREREIEKILSAQRNQNNNPVRTW